MPSLVQTDALFDECRGVSLQEWAYVLGHVWSNRHDVLILMIIRRQSFQMFQTDICFPKHLFLSLTTWQNQFYQDLLDQWGLCLANISICLKTLYKTCACLTLRYMYIKHVHVWHLDICLTKQTLGLTKQGICLYKTLPKLSHTMLYKHCLKRTKEFCFCWYTFPYISKNIFSCPEQPYMSSCLSVGKSVGRTLRKIDP